MKRRCFSFSAIAGSIQDIPNIPLLLKDRFMTAWEIDPKVVVDMAADRGPFIDQTQSMSLTVTVPNPDLLVSVRPSVHCSFLTRRHSLTFSCMPGDAGLRPACTTCALALPLIPFHSESEVCHHRRCLSLPTNIPPRCPDLQAPLLATRALPEHVTLCPFLMHPPFIICCAHCSADINIHLPRTNRPS